MDNISELTKQICEADERIGLLLDGLSDIHATTLLLDGLLIGVRDSASLAIQELSKLNRLRDH